MKTILLPTDFSSHSEKAIEFAIDIAKLSNAEILVAHSYYIPVIDANIPANVVEDMYEIERNSSEAKLKEICHSISQHTYANEKKLKCNYSAEFNLPLSEIARLSMDSKIELIIMGTEEREEFLHLLMGSVTEDVASFVTCPVLIVKKDTVYNPFHKIVYAIENIEEDMNTVKQLVPLAKLFNAEISMVHIRPFTTSVEQSDNNVSEVSEERLLESLKESLQYSKLELKFCSDDETMDGLQRIVKSDMPDLITLLKYKRNWLNSIFHKSFIKMAIKNTHLPLLILHKEK